MRTPSIRRLSGLILAVLLLAPAVPASAQDTAPTPPAGLDLEAALRAPSSRFDTSPEAEGSAGERTAPEIRLSEVRAEAWALDVGEDDPAEMVKPERKGFGRWLKKRWYVPVLAAAVLAVALDDGDNDASGEED